MGDANPIRTLGDYSKPSHEGYRNTIELPVGNNVVPLRSDTIRLVQNGCSFHGLRSEDPNQHLKDFLKLVDSLDLDGSITTWEDLTTQFLGRFFPPGRTEKLRNNILIRTIDQSVGSKLCHRNAKESWALLEDLALYDNESWNDLRDFAKPVKAISLPQDVLCTSDRHLIEIETQVQRLMEAHLALTQPTQVKKVTTSCEICSGSHDTQYCMEDPKQAFVESASSCTDEAGGLGSIIDSGLSEVVLGQPFAHTSKLPYDESLGLIRFAQRDDDVVFRMPQRKKKLDLISSLEKDKFEAFFVENLKSMETASRFTRDAVTMTPVTASGYP
ncbi:hypothetical protein Tco_0837860 [Tanacetum coccineum]